MLKIKQKNSAQPYVTIKLNQYGDFRQATTAVLKALENAPQPDISKDNDKKIDPNQMNMLIEHEFGIGRKLLTQKKYVVTKGLSQCVFMLLENEDNYLAFHVNEPGVRLNLISLIKKFSSQENIKVTLIGGISAEGYLYSSQINLIRIISELLDLSEKYTIEIKAKYLITDNAFKPEGKPQFIRNFMFYLATIAYQKIYGEALDLNEYTKHTLAEFTTKHCDEDSRLGYILIDMLKRTCPMGSEKNADEFNEMKSGFLKCMPAKEDFKRTLHALFSIENYKTLSETFGKTKASLPPAELQNFAIDLQTGTIYQINMLTTTPHEHLRFVYMLQQEANRYPYHLAFENDCYNAPTLPDNVARLLKNAGPMIEKGIFTLALEREFQKEMPNFDLNNNEVLNMFSFAAAELLRTSKTAEMKKSNPVIFKYSQLLNTNDDCKHLIDDNNGVKNLDLYAEELPRERLYRKIVS